MKFILAPLAKAINSFLKLDPESRTRLSKLAGKVVSIELQPFQFTFYCLFTGKGIELHKQSHLSADTHIDGTPLQMLGVMLHKSSRQKFFADDVKITGDAELGQQVIELFDELQIDWEEQSSRVIGDVPTQHVSQFLQKAGEWLRKTDEGFSQNVSEYIHEEKQWMPARAALQDFFNDIDTLRMDVDRIEARIDQLLKTQKSEDEQ